MSHPNDAVFLAIRREYRARCLDLSKDLEREQDLIYRLAQCRDDIANTRQVIQELETFATQRGWTTKELGV